MRKHRTKKNVLCLSLHLNCLVQLPLHALPRALDCLTASLKLYTCVDTPGGIGLFFTLLTTTSVS